MIIREEPTNKDNPRWVVRYKNKIQSDHAYLFFNSKTLAIAEYYTQLKLGAKPTMKPVGLYWEDEE